MTDEQPKIKYAQLAKRASVILTILVTLGTGFYHTTTYIVQTETRSIFKGLQTQVLLNSKRTVDLAIDRIKDKDSLTNKDEVELETLLRERDLLNKAMRNLSQEQ